MRLKIGDDVRAGKIAFDLDRMDGKLSSAMTSFIGRIRKEVSGAVAFRADNVSDYVADKDEFALSDSVPTMAPAFDSMWIEYPCPKAPNVEVGVLVSSSRIGPEAHEQDVARTWLKDSATAEDRIVVAEEIRWIMRLLIFVRMSGITLFPFGCSALLNRDGLPCDIPDAGGQAMLLSAITACPAEIDELMVKVAGTPAILTLAFLNCKNVAVEDRKIPRHEYREIQRRNEPVTKYKTLQIEPMKRVLATEGGIAHNGLKKALHICRGHFSEYTEEKPLFGKYSGRFWIPAHVRGSAEAGKVVKDYNVKAPREAA